MAMPAPMTVAKGGLGAARPRATQSDLGDYKLYTLDEPTTVAARQTKQVMFLQQAAVKFDRLYVYRLSFDSTTEAHAQGPAVTTLRLVNTDANGLGRALPAGPVSIRQPRDGTDYFLGQPEMRDVAVGQPFELELGEASDVQVSWRRVSVTGFKANGRQRQRIVMEATLTNAKGEPVTAELRQIAAGLALKVIAESQAHTTKAGDPVWRVPLSANGEAVVTYTVEVDG